ncbi:MAG: hypothetical protein BWK79_15100 [Beggiatoa sp. IS2]|nr:MAG: hypothetical protein BWK79_15100 [Beggiatoa sp. IS2]
MTIQTFGHFIRELPKQEEYLTIGFLPSSRSLKKRWENNGLSADFIADYYRTFFISSQEDALTEESVICMENLRDSVKYIANELLENAMKFQDETLPFVAQIEFSLYNDCLVFCATNGVNGQQATHFQSFIEQLLGSDPEELYFNAMKNSAKEGNRGSGLGLLSMICDHAAKLGWKFEVLSTTEPPVTTVSTMVYLEI